MQLIYEILRKVITMIKFAFMMALFMTVQEVQLQRSPYAGSANRFRGLPVNIVPAVSSLQSNGIAPLAATQVKPEISLAGRVSNEFIPNRNQDQYRDYYHDHHRHGDWHNHRGESNYNDFY